MKMNRELKQIIKDKYPNALKYFIDYRQAKFKETFTMFDPVYNEDNYWGDYVCFCDYQNFFNDFGIIIIIDVNLSGGYFYKIHKKFSQYVIREFKNTRSGHHDTMNKTKELAILKVFEMLENDQSNKKELI
jgi:hypothetical protein